MLRFASFLVCATAVCGLANGQTTGSPFEPEVQGLILEAKVDPAAVFPAFDQELVAFIGAGELRARIDNWNFRGRNYRLSVFVVPAGAPLPTMQLPESTSAAMLVQAGIRMESLFHYSNPDLGPGLAVAGRVMQKFGGVGQIEPGILWMLGFTFPADSIGVANQHPVAFDRVTIWSPGETTVYLGRAQGSILVAAPRGR